MLPIDNVTTIYLTGFLALFFSSIHLILFRKLGKPILAWALGSALQGLGTIDLLNGVSDGLPTSWVIAPLLLLLGNLITLGGLGLWGGYRLPLKPALLCLFGIVSTGGLFLFSRSVGAPLGSLEAIILAPIAASHIYSAWFSGTLVRKNHNKYIHLISLALWVEGLLMAALTLGAIAAIGDQYVILKSKVVLTVSLTYFICTLLMNMSWAFQSLDDLVNEKRGMSHKKLSNHSDEQFNKISKPSSKAITINSEESTHKGKKGLSKVTAKNMEMINPDLLTDAEKLELFNKLTDKEKEVFFLVIDDKKNDEIAILLNSTTASIKVHKSRMTTKLCIKKLDDLKKLMQPNAELRVTHEAPIKVKENTDVTLNQESFNLS